jgi:hypothetical protein
MLDATKKAQPSGLTLRVLALACLLVFLATGFRRGFQQDETDFPNYYAAAVLVRTHAPLRKFYDWTWFAREMDKVGIGTRVGSYTPQTPLTMLPMVGFARLPLQQSKQVWLVLNLVFLAISLWMLSQVSGRAVLLLWVFTFCGYFALNANFILGQYYVFLLFLLTATVYLMHKEQFWAAGAIAGLAFALKLYGGPYLLFFIAIRKWKAAAGMIATMLGSVAMAIALFGWTDVRYYILQLLPRFLEGGAVDPYNVRNQTMSTVLRRCFLIEPQLNPQAWWNAPAAFFFFRAFFTLSVLSLLYLGARKTIHIDRTFAWCVVAILLLSTNLSSYTFILLLLPFVLLLDKSKPFRSVILAVSCLFLSFPLHGPGLFWKMWLLLGLFVLFGWEHWKQVPASSWALAAITIVVGATFISWNQIRSYRQEPAQSARQLNLNDHSLFSSFPVITSAGLFFQSMDPDRYVIRWVHDGTVGAIRVDGNAFHPIPLPDGFSIAVEDSYSGRSMLVRFDPATNQMLPLAIPVITNDSAIPVPSPDGRWVAFESDEAGFQHLWLRNLTTGRRVRIAGGNCDSSWPAWESDSRAVVFASDCGRAVGLPVLYRVEIPAQ